MGLALGYVCQRVSDNGHLTREIWDEAIAQMKRREEEESRRYAERVREVASRGPYRSKLGRVLDAVYIRGGPIIVSLRMKHALEEELERAEAEARCEDS